MFKQHFGMTHTPLSKQTASFWDDGFLSQLQKRFDWLLQSPGVGLLTGEPGVGKTAWLRTMTNALNPHRYQVIYTSDTDFGRLDIYRQLALAFGLEPAFRRAMLWRQLKEHITELHENKNILPIWVIDEAQNLPYEFFKDFPSFLNFAFDSKDLMTVWLVGHTQLGKTLDRYAYSALSTRIQVREVVEPVFDRERFANMIQHAFKDAGSLSPMISDSGIELIRMASKGNLREAHQIIQNSLRLAADKKLNHLPDDVINEAIESLR